MMNRRGFLTGLLAAPVVITTPGLLMPVRPVWTGFHWAEGDTYEITPCRGVCKLVYLGDDRWMLLD